jgi:Alkylmercury lyase
MNEADLEVRNHVYRRFAEFGGAPTLAELEQEFGHAVAGALRRLHDAHALVLDAATGEIRMASPFSTVPTPHVVETNGRSWYANCGWDAFGIAAALHADAQISSTCPDCGDAIEINVRDEQPTPNDYLFHTVVSAAHWWDDIVFT